MNNETLLAFLEDVARRLTINVDYDDLRKGEVDTPGGLFLLNGERRILIHKGLLLFEKVSVLLKILSDLDTEDIHMPPEVRERIEKIKG